MEKSGGERESTNNRMELQAVVEGLRQLKRGCVVELEDRDLSSGREGDDQVGLGEERRRVGVLQHVLRAILRDARIDRDGRLTRFLRRRRL